MVLRTYFNYDIYASEKWMVKLNMQYDCKQQSCNGYAGANVFGGK